MGARGKVLLLLGLLAAGGPLRGTEAALDRELAEVHAAVAPYRDADEARAAGWRPVTGPVPLMGAHWSLGPNGPDYVAGDALDLGRPSNLIFAEIDGRLDLVAVAFVVRLGPDDPLPEGFSGDGDVWHVHDVDAILAAIGEERALAARIGREWAARRLAPDGRRRLAMVHVWLDGRNPLGPFADVDPTLPFRQAGLSQGVPPDVPVAAARGLALTLPGGCRDELTGKLRLAGLGRWRIRELLSVCEAHADHLREVLEREPAALLPAAAEIWRSFEDRLYLALEPAEIARMAALVEGPASFCTPDR